MRATGSGQGVAGSRSEAGGWEATMDGERGRRRIVAGLRSICRKDIEDINDGCGRHGAPHPLLATCGLRAA